MANSRTTAPTSNVASTAEGVAKGAAETAGAVKGIGQRLYGDAVCAAAATNSAARTAASEAGNGPFARAIKTGRRYSDGLYQHLRDWQDFHDGMHGDLGRALGRSGGYQSRFADGLTGEAGDAVQADLQANHRLWGAHQDKHESASQVAHTAAWKVSNAQGEIDNLAEAGEREFNDAVRRKDPVAALDVYTRYSTDADNVVAKYHPEVISLIQSAGFDVPLSPVQGDPGAQGDGDTDGDRKDGDGKKTDGTGNDPALSNTTNNRGFPNRDPANTPPGITNISEQSTLLGATRTLPETSPTDNPPATADGSRGFPNTALPQQIPRMPSGGSGGSGSTGGGMGSGTDAGLSSGMKPPSSLGSLSGANAATSPASAMSGGSPAQAGPSPLANAGNNFKSGLASGMGASGGMAPAMAQHEQPLQPMANQQPMVTSNAPVNPAGMPSSGSVTATADVAAAGHGGGGAPAGGMGGTMMPPAAMGAAQPLAPYSPAGSGAGGGGAPTSAAAGGPSGAQPGAPTQSATPAGAAPPMLTGNPGSSAAMSALAGTSRDVNPDVVLAQRVLAELVAGSDASTTLASWAVSVLRSSFGSQILVAGNMGGGWYLPPAVYLPIGVKLAVCDPALPVGWAETWMGSQKPSRILIDHFARLQESANRVPGLVFSALVTTDRAGTPSDFLGDYVAMEHMEARALCPDPPELDAAHQHRLATIHPGLAARVHSLAAAGDANAALTATVALTNVVYTGLKAHPDAQGFGQPLVAEEDERILSLLNRGHASEEAWAEYDAAVQIRGGGAALWPEQFQGVQDNDDSETARHAMRLYEHYYRTSRLIELINCWRRRPPALAEIAYSAITSGFGAAVVKTLNDVELRSGGPRP